MVHFDIFCNQSTTSPEYQSKSQKEIPEHHVREAVNPRTGRRERVFVNLEAIYPHHHDPTYGMSFEELRAISRGWMDKDWRSQRRTLKEVSGNTACRHSSSVNEKESASDGLLAAEVDKSLTLWDSNSHQMETTVNQTENRDGKTSKARKIKVREVKGETLISEFVLNLLTLEHHTE
jgi:checkpoint serine/threonine-protein kinase